MLLNFFFCTAWQATAYDGMSFFKQRCAFFFSWSKMVLLFLRTLVGTSTSKENAGRESDERGGFRHSVPKVERTTDQP